MEKGYKILGNYIRLVDERNRNLAITKLLGVSINKKFIPSIANILRLFSLLRIEQTLTTSFPNSLSVQRNISEMKLL